MTSEKRQAIEATEALLQRERQAANHRVQNLRHEVKRVTGALTLAKRQAQAMVTAQRLVRLGLYAGLKGPACPSCGVSHEFAAPGADGRCRVCGKVPRALRGKPSPRPAAENAA